jgi:hypothetical protein
MCHANNVLSSLPGVNCGKLYEEYLKEHQHQKPMAAAGGVLAKKTKDESTTASTMMSPDDLAMIKVGGNDLEHCFFINHDGTGGCCAVYRSLEKKLIVVSFRGICTPIDLVTDASIVQEPWVQGENKKNEDTDKVHVGFRKSLNSIARRLKEMILAMVEPGDRVEEYDMLVTGHSLGGTRQSDVLGIYALELFGFVTTRLVLDGDGSFSILIGLHSQRFAFTQQCVSCAFVRVLLKK